MSLASMTAVAAKAETSKPTPELVFRPPTTPELHLVRSSWARVLPGSEKIGSGLGGVAWVHMGTEKGKTGTQVRSYMSMALPAWYRASDALRDQVLSSMNSGVIVAALKSAPTELAGYAVYEREPSQWTVWWVHVVGEARRSGIGTALLHTLADVAEGTPLAPGQMTPRGKQLWDKVNG